MERGKVPKMCSSNGLTVDILPDISFTLTELENNLIAKNIIFQKLHKKPKSRWSGTHDRLVNIPIGDQDILNTVKNLPRTPAEAGIISVKLKRKLEYKNTHTEQLIDTEKIYKYLDYLKNVAKNKNYQFYDDLNIFMQRCQDKDPEGLKLIDPEEDEIAEHLDPCQSVCQPEDEVNIFNKNEDDDGNEGAETDEEKEDIEYRTKDPVRKQQFDYDKTTCMTPKFPEAIPEYSDSDISFAPGEGKIPTSILSEEDWDINSFPNLHPTGTNGLHQNRKIDGLIDQQYFEQRLKNQYTKFEQCAPYVFAAAAYIEEKQLERNIGISASKGKKSVNKTGERSYTLNDGFAVMDNVKGTPRYWKKAKMEMLGKLDNFGPFHLFYTLSCGDMRWNENFSSILGQKGYNIVWTAENGNEVTVEVEFEKAGVMKIKTLKDFLAREVDESLHELFTATRNFVQRLKALRKEIMMGQNNPMAIENFSDKMEFQGRGAGHIHEAAWCNLKKVSQDLDIEPCLTDSEDDFEEDSEDEFEIEATEATDSYLERAFKKLRKDDKLKKKGRKSPSGFCGQIHNLYTKSRYGSKND